MHLASGYCVVLFWSLLWNSHIIWELMKIHIGRQLLKAPRLPDY